MSASAVVAALVSLAPAIEQGLEAELPIVAREVSAAYDILKAYFEKKALGEKELAEAADAAADATFTAKFGEKL